MFNLSHVRQLVIYRLNDCSFPKQHLIRDTHQRVLHLVFQLGYQLDTVDEEFTEQVFTDVAPVGNDLAVQLLGKTLHLERVTVINVARREHEVDDFAHLVTDDVQLEAKEPSHRALASLRNALEGLVLEDALVLAHPQRGAVDETDASALAHQNGLDEHSKFDYRPLLQLNETVVGHGLREQVPHVLAHIIQIEVLQASVTGIVEQDQNGHHLGVRHPAITVIFAFLLGMTFS